MPKMFMLNIFFAIIFCCTTIGLCDITDNELKMVEDLVTAFINPTFFIVSGFNKQDAVSILTELFRNGYQSAVYNNSMTFTGPKQDCVFLLNINSPNSTNILLKANESNQFAFPFKWLILNTDEEISVTEITEKYFTNISILVNSEVMIINKEDDNTFLINEIYKRNKTGIIATEEIGNWTLELGFQRNEKPKITAVRRKNLMRTILRTSIVITHNDTLKHLTDYRDKHIDSITKVNYILVKHLSDIVNASLRYSIKTTWGYKTNFSTWTGMIGELTKDRADTGGTPLFVTTDRVPVIDYIAMTTATRSHFVFRQPKLSYVTNVFTLPFHWTVWLASAALVLATTATLAGMLLWEKKASEMELVASPQMEPPDAMLVSLGAVCQQGAAALPLQPAGRVVALCTFTALMFLYTSYSANIVALLQSSSNSIHTLQDLLKSRLAVGVDDTVFNRFYFPAATEPIRRALYLQKVAPKNQAPRFYPIEDGVRRMRQGLFAFHMEGGSGYKIVSETFYEDEKCDLQEISFLQVPDPWLAIQKNSSYKEMLKIGLRKIHESGIQAREVSRVYTRKPQCHGGASSFVSVSMVDIYSAMVVFAIGLVACLGVFLLEIMVHRRNLLLRMKFSN